MRHAAALGGGFLLLAIVWTWPLAWHLGSRIPHDSGDPLLNIWLVWWNAHAIPFTAAWWSPPIFDPMRGALALSEHLAGLGVITTPVQLVGASPLAAYNISLILSFALSGSFASLLVWRLTRSRLAAVVAGVAFGFAPYRAGQLAHLQVLTSQWMALALLALHAYIEDGRGRWLAVFAAAWLIQALSNGYYLLFFPVLVILWLAWFGRSRRGIALGSTWLLSSLLLLPGLLEYARVQRGLGLGRTPGEMWLFSASAHSFVTVPRMLALWASGPAPNEEHYLFPGVTAIAIVAIGGLAATRVARGRREFLFYAVAAVVMYALALGPAAPGSGAWALIHPYSILVHLPGYHALRVPARFAMLGTLCLAVATGLAVDRLRSLDPRIRYALVAVALLGLAADGWMRTMPLLTPPGRIDLPLQPGAAVLELPAEEGQVSTAAMYRAMQHRRPLVNGYSGHTPPHYEVLSTAIARGDPSVILELARGRPLIVVVTERFDPGGELRRFVESIPGVEARGTSSAGSTYVVPALPVPQDPPLGSPVEASVGPVDRNRVELDLGAERIVRAVEFPLRWHAPELDPRVAVEVSRDGVTWTTVWENWTGGLALRGALEDPIVAPVRMFVGDVPARYVRVHPAPRWFARELRVYSAR